MCIDQSAIGDIQVAKQWGGVSVYLWTYLVSEFAPQLTIIQSILQVIQVCLLFSNKESSFGKALSSYETDMNPLEIKSEG